MKPIILSLFLVTVVAVNSQEISNIDLQKLEDLQLSTQKLDLSDLTVQKDLNQILFLDKKRKTNKTLSLVFSSAAAISVVTGSILLSKENTTSDVVGGIFMSGVLIYGGISIPFWVASKKRKKERDKLLELY